MTNWPVIVSVKLHLEMLLINGAGYRYYSQITSEVSDDLLAMILAKLTIHQTF